jgi:DNA-directed RNA polymerase I and III subunit RPAC1
MYFSFFVTVNMDLSNITMDKLTLKEFDLQHTSTPIVATAKKFTQKDFKAKLKINFVWKEHMMLEFDMIGVDPSLINAFRRILISEVPTMAIEKVHIFNNTSIIQDEVFAHRLGLVPLGADPRQFNYKDPSTDDFGK